MSNKEVDVKLNQSLFSNNKPTAPNYTSRHNQLKTQFKNDKISGVECDNDFRFEYDNLYQKNLRTKKLTRQQHKGYDKTGKSEGSKFKYFK